MYVSDSQGTHYSLFAYEEKEGDPGYTGAMFDNLKALAPMVWFYSVYFNSNGGSPITTAGFDWWLDSPDGENHHYAIPVVFYNYGYVDALPAAQLGQIILLRGGILHQMEQEQKSWQI